MGSGCRRTCPAAAAATVTSHRRDVRGGGLYDPHADYDPQ